jgi:hypothetical protein
VNASRWVIRGSRPLPHSLVGRSAKANVVRSCGTRQSGSPPGVGYQYVRPAFTNFENEDDDEDDFRDLRDLDLPSLIDRIRDGLDHFHVLQAFTETGLG